MRDDSLRFRDMAESIDKIGKYTAAGKDTFVHDELIQIWVVQHLQILGEAARGVSDETQRKYPAIPWGKIIGFRNILVHHYFAVNPDQIWAVVEADIPALKRELERILSEHRTDL